MVEFKELERDRDVVKMTHKKVKGCDWREVKSHFDEFPSKPKPSQEAADTHSEPQTAKRNHLVVQPSHYQTMSEDEALCKPTEELDLDAALVSHKAPKERMASKPRKKRRPQSLNLGGPAKLIYRNADTDSSSAGEENKGFDSDNPLEQRSPMTENHCDSSQRALLQDWDGSDPSKKDGKQEDLPIGVVSDWRASPLGPTGTDPGYSGPANGPERPTHDGPLVGLRGESARKIRGKGLIDDKELADVKLRQVKTHEKRVGGFGAEDTEGPAGRTLLRRLSGSAGGSTYPLEITRIVPLKPERSKSMACKDERDKAGSEELSSRFFRREYRWSVGSSVEGPPDLHWTEAHDPDGEAPPLGRGFSEGQSSASKMSPFPKTVPPAPPVKTQKARESGLILRNSRSAGWDSSADAAKKRHSVTLPSSLLSASAIPVIETLKSIA